MSLFYTSYCNALKATNSCPHGEALLVDVYLPAGCPLPVFLWQMSLHLCGIRALSAPQIHTKTSGSKSHTSLTVLVSSTLQCYPGYFLQFHNLRVYGDICGEI